MGYGNRWQRSLDAANEIWAGLAATTARSSCSPGRTLEVLGTATRRRRRARADAEHREARLVPRRLRTADALARRPAADRRAARRARSRDRRAGHRHARAFRRARAAAPGRDRAARRGDGAGRRTGPSTASARRRSRASSTASVRSFAPAAATKTLTLTQNGRTVATKTVEVPAGGRAQAAFPALDLSSGPNRVEATLTPADELTADDQRYLVAEAPRAAQRADRVGRYAGPRRVVRQRGARDARCAHAEARDQGAERARREAARDVQLRRRHGLGPARLRRKRAAEGLCRKGRQAVARGRTAVGGAHDPARDRRTPRVHGADERRAQHGDRRRRQHSSRAARRRRPALGDASPARSASSRRPRIACWCGSRTARRS